MNSFTEIIGYEIAYHSTLVSPIGFSHPLGPFLHPPSCSGFASGATFDCLFDGFETSKRTKIYQAGTQSKWTNRRTFSRWTRMSTGSSRVRLFVPPGGGRGTKCARTRIRLHTPVDQKGSSWVDGLNRGVWNSRFPSKQRSEIVPPAIGNGLAEENKLTNNSRTGIEPTWRSRAQKNNTFLSLFISPVRETYNK